MIVLVMCVLALLYTACVPLTPMLKPPRAVDGALDLSGWDFATDGAVSLEGTWEFYWQQHLRYDDFVAPDPPVPTGMIRVPGVWNGYDVIGQRLPGHGFATYRLRVVLGYPRARLALRVLDVATAFSVSINGQRLLSVGVPGETRATTVPRFAPQVVDVQPETDHLDIVVQVSNFHHRKGGMWEKIRLGAVADLRADRERTVTLGIFLSGSILIMGLYHLGLFVIRRQEKAPLYFGLYCLLIAARIVSTGERYLVSMMPDFPWELLVKTSYLTFYLGVPVFALYFHCLFREDALPKVIWTIVAVTLPFSLLVCMTPAAVYSYTTQEFQVLTVFAGGYGLYVLGLAVRRKRESALAFLSGFFVLFACLLNDMLYANLLIYTTYVSPFGFFMFIFLQAFLLSHRFSKAFALVEEQQQELRQTNHAYVREIRERQRAEEALRASESALAEAQRIAHLGNWEWELTTDRLRWSEEVFRILGLPPCTPSHELARSCIHPDDWRAWERAIQVALTQHTPFRLDYRIHRPDGGMAWIHSEAQVIRDEAGKPSKVIGTLQDITERKHMEDELLKASKLESIGVLAGGIAHDFNNILTAIIGNLSLARTDILPTGTSYQRLAEVERAAARATALTQQLLTFAKGGAPVKKRADIADLLTEAAVFALRGSNVRAEFALADDLWLAEVDVGQITRVIHNLILNAAQAMPEGGTIHVRAENVESGPLAGASLSPGNYVVISVQDHGTGIPTQILANIFDPYFTTKPTGSGLGLATAYSIVKRHAGSITVTSQEGVGTIFAVYLPAVQADLVSPSEDARPLHHGTGRVLVMDDEAPLRQLARHMLEHLGYTADLVKDGAEALACYQEARAAGAPFAAVMLDLTIPGGMGGKETMQRLLEIDPEVRAIVASGYSNDPVMAAFTAYGFRAMVAKPYSLEDLSQALCTALPGRNPSPGD